MNQTKPKTKREYINNHDFLTALVEYKEKCYQSSMMGIPTPRIPDYIGLCFLKISEGLSRRPNFINYTYKDEMISDAVENCIMYMENFDPLKSRNAFSYFTTVCWYAFLRRIQREKKQLYIKYKATEQMCVLDEQEIMELEDGHHRQFEMYDNIGEFIETFEENKRSKKILKKNVPVGLDIFFE